jgi:hypothetical protein
MPQPVKKGRPTALRRDSEPGGKLRDWADPARLAGEGKMTRHVLAHSSNYSVSHEYETVWLTRPDGTTTVIGDFYGDPEAAVIDWKERWCVVVGAGLVLYHLREPFLPYECDQDTQQWWEAHRDRTDLWWIEAVYQVTEKDLRFVVDPYDNNAGVYELDTESMAIRRLIPPEQGGGEL